jgi:hypothetical protein
MAPIRNARAMPEENARATFEMILVHPQQAERIDDAILGVVSEQPGIGFDNELCSLPLVVLPSKCKEGQTGAKSLGGGGETNQHLESTRDKLHRHFFRSFSVLYNEWFSARKHLNLCSLQTNLLWTHKSSRSLGKLTLDEDPLPMQLGRLLSRRISRASRLYRCSTTPIPRLDQRYSICVRPTLDSMYVSHLHWLVKCM